MKTLFDHTRSTVAEAMGFSEEQISELNDRLREMTKDIITSSPKVSELAEKIAQTFSYNELLLLTSRHIVQKAAETSIRELLGIVKELNKEED